MLIIKYLILFYTNKDIMLQFCISNEVINNSINH